MNLNYFWFGECEWYCGFAVEGWLSGQTHTDFTKHLIFYWNLFYKYVNIDYDILHK